MASPPTLLRITAHSTPHPSDPPNAHELYAALGMLAVAWGRLEGHVIGNLLTIMNFPEVANSGPLPLAWEKRLDLWKRAFNNVPALKSHKDRAVQYMRSIIAEVDDRNLTAHAIWEEFIPDATEPTITARTVQPKKGAPGTVEVGDYRVSITLLRNALAAANRLNFEMTEFTRLLSSVRPPPADAHRF
jgi:hypothetical protein